MLVRKLNDDMKLPRSISHGVRTAACVVVIQPPVGIGCQADIEVGDAFYPERIAL